MSQENVELVRRTWEAAKRGDPEPAAAAMAPDGEMDLTTGGRMDAEIYLGPDGVRRAYQAWASPWDSMVMEATAFIDVSEDQLIVHFTRAWPFHAYRVGPRTRPLLGLHDA
jgi:ketosteroid isomerase-like protein